MAEKDVFALVERNNYLKINLDNITHNINVIRKLCSEKTGVIGVIKTSAYGHGLVETGKHLKSIGVERLATAVVEEAAYLRNGGVTGPIHVLNCAQVIEIPDLMKYRLIPTASDRDFIEAWGNSQNNVQTIGNNEELAGMIALKVDTGLSRNGIQIDEVDSVIQLCDDLGVKIESIYTHFGVGKADEDFLKMQLAAFNKIVDKYRPRGYKFHTSASQGIVMGYGLDFDFVRPGKSMFGLNGDMGIGFKACLALMTRPMLVKPLAAGRDVGYDRTYRCPEDMVVATFGLGFGDGLPMSLANKGKLKNDQGKKFPIVGKVSSGAFMAKVDSLEDRNGTFYVISDDFDSETSIVGWANELGVMGSVITANLNARLPKVYFRNNEISKILKGIELTH